MPCFFNKLRIRKLLFQLEITNYNALYEEMLKQYTDDELHQMSEEKLIELIREIHLRLKKLKPMTKEIEMMYR
jgi:hypothetical protein